MRKEKKKTETETQRGKFQNDSEFLRPCFT